MGPEIEIAEMENRAGRIKLGLAEIKEKYDFIFLDCPPSLGLITVNALAAVDSVIIPIQCEYYALEGLSQLMNTIRQVKKIYNPLIDIEGILLTMFDGRLNLTQQVMGEVKKYFPMKVYSTVIPEMSGFQRHHPSDNPFVTTTRLQRVQKPMMNMQTNFF